MIKKAVILCGGRGTRFRPITTVVPKELLPIVDTPVLTHIINELKASGIKEILLIINKEKEIIRNYYQINKIEDISLFFEYQHRPLGSADALMYAKDFVSDDNFVLALGDDLIANEYPVSKQLMDAFKKNKGNILGVQKVDSDDITMYGVIDGEFASENLLKIKKIVEKPSLDKIPSRYAALGRYVFCKEIFEALKKTPIGINNEYQLTDAINILSQSQNVFAYSFDGKRYDMGNKFGALKAIVEMSLNNEIYGNKFLDFLHEFLK